MYILSSVLSLSVDSSNTSENRQHNVLITDLEQQFPVENLLITETDLFPDTY